MPQKGKSKSSTTRKSTAAKRPAKKTARKTRKPKVYIPAYKIIIFCGSIIAICMFLLLLTTAFSPSTSKSDNQLAKASAERTAPASKKDDAKVSNDSQSQSQTTAPKNTAASSKPASSASSPAATTSNAATTSQPAASTVQTSASPAKASSSTAQTSASPAHSAAPAQSAFSANQGASSAKPNASTANSTAFKPTQNTASPVHTTTSQTQNAASGKNFGFPRAVNNAQLIFVFDDGGQNLSHLESFMSLPFPFTVAVLPRLAHSEESAARVRRSGNEVILHQPMQSINTSVNPGPGAITPSMTESQIMTTLFQNINSISPIAGLNNHEGSAITANAEQMAVVMKVASENGIYFLDSRTNVETKVPEVAQAMGYSYYERNIFLDNEKTRANALKELNKGLALANKNGSVIMIGHIWSADFLPALLKEAYPELKEKGYTFSVVSSSRAKKR